MGIALVGADPLAIHAHPDRDTSAHALFRRLAHIFNHVDQSLARLDRGFRLWRGFFDVEFHVGWSAPK